MPLSNPSRKRIVILASAFLALAVLWFGGSYIWLHQKALMKLVQRSPLKSTEFKVNVPGMLYLSLVPGAGTAPSGIYTYTLDSGTFGRILADINWQLPMYYIYTSPSLSNDGRSLVFVRRGKGELTPQVFIAAPDGSGARQLTKNSSRLKRDPVMSPDSSDVAYEASNASGVAGAEIGGVPNDWSIFLTNMTGDEFRIASGTNPLFSPDGTHLLALESDGLHLFDISTGKTAKDTSAVLRLPNLSGYHWSRASISSDGSRIAWAVPDARQVIVGRISWDPLMLSVEKVIPVTAYQALFSPDGTHMAIEEVRPSSGRVDNHIVISIYDTGSWQSADAINLTKYTNTYIRLGGWGE